MQSPFATFVKKLQESLTRMEPFDVVTVAQGGDGKSTGVFHLAIFLRITFLQTQNAVHLHYWLDSYVFV